MLPVLGCNRANRWLDRAQVLHTSIHYAAVETDGRIRRVQRRAELSNIRQHFVDETVDELKQKERTQSKAKKGISTYLFISLAMDSVRWILCAD